MDLFAALALQIIYGIANLVLISIGLAVIFGMMRVINLAHGEFLMLGGYTVIVATNSGVNIWIAMFILAPLIVGIIGLIVEWCLIRFLYGRMVDTLLATWGLSLFFIGLITTIFGAQTATTISPPFGAITIGEYSSSGYELFLIFMAVLAIVLVYLLLRYTKLGKDPCDFGSEFNGASFIINWVTSGATSKHSLFTYIPRWSILIVLTSQYQLRIEQVVT